jgi:Domain of unknown function (DUF6983)
MIEIPAPTSQNVTQITTLSGRDYVFTFHWNARESAWYFDLADQDEVLIVTSRKVTVAFPLITRCVDERRPEGMLIAIDSTGHNQDPGLDDFGTRVKLFYLEKSDVPA